MTLTDEQKAKVAEWIEAGANLNEIQERLRSELDITITFLETRFLLADLDLEIKEPKAPEEPEKPVGETAPAEAEIVTEEAAATGAVQVGVDQIARPGAAVSGKVAFSDGKRATWYVTQYGELGLDPEEEGYRPSEADVMVFQTELQRLLRREGF